MNFESKQCMAFVRSEDLWIVRLAEKLAGDLAQYIGTWSFSDKKLIGFQLLGAAYSVGANIVEGHGRSHGADALRFYYIARGSLEESKYWIRRAEAVNLLDKPDADHLRGEYQRLSLSINAFIAGHKKRRHLT